MIGRSWTTGAFAACTFAFLVSSGNTSQASAPCTDYSDITCVAQHAVEAANKFRAEYSVPDHQEYLFKKLGILLVRADVQADGVTAPTPWADDGLKDGIALAMLEEGDLDTVVGLLASRGRDNVREKAIEQLLQQGRYAEARSIQRNADTFGPRQKMLAMISRARAEAGEVEEAVDNLLFELELMSKMKEAQDYLAEPLCWTLTALADLRSGDSSADIDESLPLRLAVAIENPARRETEIRETAWCLAENGRFNLALDLVSWIGDQRKRSDQVANIIGYMTRAGDVAGAREAFRLVSANKSARLYANSVMAGGLVDLGYVADAEDMLPLMEGLYPPTLTYAELADAFLERGEDAKALGYVRKIEEAVVASSRPAWRELKVLYRFSHLIEQATINGYLDTNLKRLRSEKHPSRFDVADAAEVLALYSRPDEAVNLILTFIPEHERLSALVAVGHAMSGLER